MEYSKRKIRKNRHLFNFIIVTGVFLVLISSLFFAYKFYKNKVNENITNKKVESFFETKDNVLINRDETTKQSVIKETTNDYIGILEIPRINLKRGLVDKTSSYNNVDKNIYQLKETILPDEQTNSHIILAAHSGNSSVSFFKNLKKLEINDKVNFYYKGIKYIYEVFDKYEIEKIGTLKINQTDISDITLITCVNGTNRQLIYVAKLINKENY